MREVIAPPIRVARLGDFPNVTNMGSLSTVLFATQKPAWVGSLAAGLRFIASTTRDAACGESVWAWHGEERKWFRSPSNLQAKYPQHKIRPNH